MIKSGSTGCILAKKVTLVKKETKIRPNSLWEFLQNLLNDSERRYLQYVQWKNCEEGIFKIVDPPGLATLWGIKKHIPNMNYDKMSRSLRNYYKTNKLKKVSGQRQCFQFVYSSVNPPQVDVTQSHFMSNLGVVNKNLAMLVRNPVMDYGPPFPTEAVYTNEVTGIKEEVEHDDPSYA